MRQRPDRPPATAESYSSSWLTWSALNVDCRSAAPSFYLFPSLLLHLLPRYCFTLPSTKRNFPAAVDKLFTISVLRTKINVWKSIRVYHVWPNSWACSYWMITRKEPSCSDIDIDRYSRTWCACFWHFSCLGNWKFLNSYCELISIVTQILTQIKPTDCTQTHSQLAAVV